VKKLVCLALLFAACRGQPSSKPPIHLIGDMDNQPKYQAMEASKFYETYGNGDGRAMRQPVDGTVAWGQTSLSRRPDPDYLRADSGYYEGRVGNMWVGKIPPQVKVDAALLRRGEERYNIYCAPCHDRAGTGVGMVAQRGLQNVRNLAEPAGKDARVPNMSDGELFGVITTGIRGMPSYRKQIPVADRWAIVAWVRVLSRAGNGKLADVPPDRRNDIEEKLP
jgi:mono/diheme cytochrome c family protein